jgi:cysteine sulfinate desulfinase/cysteine desulfurase-like protein
MNTPIYLDYNATTPVDPRVLEAAASVGAWQSLTA